MARVKQTANLANQASRDTTPTNSSPSHSQPQSETLGSTNSSGTPTPQGSPISKRVSKPTEKVLAKEKNKGKGIATEPEKKRKAPPQEKLLKDAIKSSKASKPTSSPPKKKTKKGSSIEDLSILLSSLESRTRFLSDFASRKIHDARIVHFAYFDANGFNFQDYLRHYNMGDFLSTNLEYYPRLVQVFYTNFKLLEDGFESEIKGKKISMTYREFSTFTKLPFYGQSVDGKVNEDSQEGAWEVTFDRNAAIRELMQDNFTEGTSLPAGQMKVQYRLLLYVLSRILVPRSGNHVVVQQLDVTLLWGITQALPMSWAWIILGNMRDMVDKKGAMLPYPLLITRLIKRFKISVVGEVKKTNTHLFGETIINQMKLKRINGIWTRPQEDDAEAAPQLDQHEVLVKLTELIASQAEHNAKMELALADLQSRMGAIEKHLSLQMTFDDIVNVGQEATQVDPPPATDPKDLDKETLAEPNTAVSPSSSANRDA